MDFEHTQKKKKRQLKTLTWVKIEGQTEKWKKILCDWMIFLAQVSIMFVYVVCPFVCVYVVCLVVCLCLCCLSVCLCLCLCCLSGCLNCSIVLTCWNRKQKKSKTPWEVKYQKYNEMILYDSEVEM